MKVVPGTAPPEEHRLTLGDHPLTSVHGDKHWRLESRCGTLQPEWRAIYQFTETEYFPADYNVWNHSGLTRMSDGLWRSIFPEEVIAVKYFFVNGDDESRRRCPSTQDEKFQMGRLIVWQDKVRRQVGDKMEVLRVLRNELERIAAIREVLGIEIADEDVKHIRPIAKLENRLIRSKVTREYKF